MTKKTNQSMEVDPEMTDDGISSQALKNSYYNCIHVYRKLDEKVNMLSRENISKRQIFKNEKTNHLIKIMNKICKQTLCERKYMNGN